jgi:hypothetical protein
VSRTADTRKPLLEIERMKAAGMFIDVELDAAVAKDAAAAKKLTEVCPVNIFAHD